MAYRTLAQPLENRDFPDAEGLTRSQAAVFQPFDAGTPEHPFVIAQLGQSLDGRVATITGDSKYINGDEALDHLHRIRARVDAVVVGVGTVIADDPQLTVRRVAGPHPARVVIDPSGRLPDQARCLHDPSARRIVIRSETAPERPAPGSAPVETLRLPAPGGLLCPRAIVAALGRLGFARILIEGGPRTIAAFLEAGTLSRLHLLVSPVIIGSGRAGLDLAPVPRLSDALRPRTQAHLLSGGDVLFDCDLTGSDPPAPIREA